MNILTDLKKFTANSFVSLFGSRNYGNISDTDLWDKGFLTNSIVYSVINNISSKVGSLPYELTDKDEVTDDTDAYNELFFNNWNQDYGHEEGMRLTAVNLLNFGVAFIQKKGDGIIPDELFVLPNQCLTRQQSIIGFYENPKYYDFYDGSKSYRIPTEDLIIIRLPYDLKRKSTKEGLSPLQPVWDTVIASNNRAEAEKSLFENRGAIGIISPKGNKDGGRIPNLLFNVLQDSLKNLIGGAKKANKVVQAQVPLDFTQIGMSANDLKLIESEKMHVRRIAGVYQYPSQLVGDTDASQYANYAEALKAAYRDVILPTADLIINEFQRSFFNQINPLLAKDYKLIYNKSNIVSLNEHWSEKLNKMPVGVASKVIETLTPEEVEQIKFEIGLRYE